MDENINTADAGVVNDPPAAADSSIRGATPGSEGQPTTTKAARAAGVKGVTKTAKDLKAAGKTRAEVGAAVTAMYQAAGKSEKVAKNAASVIVYNIFGAVKPRALPTDA